MTPQDLAALVPVAMLQLDAGLDPARIEAQALDLRPFYDGYQMRRIHQTLCNSGSASPELRLEAAAYVHRVITELQSAITHPEWDIHVAAFRAILKTDDLPGPPPAPAKRKRGRPRKNEVVA